MREILVVNTVIINFVYQAHLLTVKGFTQFIEEQ